MEDSRGEPRTPVLHKISGFIYYYCEHFWDRKKQTGEITRLRSVSPAGAGSVCLDRGSKSGKMERTVSQDATANGRQDC